MKKEVAEHLSSMLSLGPEDIQPLIDSFMESFQTGVEDLRQQLPAPDFQKIRFVTHSFNGFAPEVGAEDLHTLSISLNTAAKALDAGTCQTYINKIIELYEAYKADEFVPMA